MTPTDPQPHRARPTSVGKSPALYLLGSTFAYFALWLLVPKATFLPKAVNAILTAMPFAKGELALVLNLLCMIMLSAPTVAFMAIQISIVYHFAKLKPDFKWGVISLAISLGSAAAITALIVRNVVVKHPLILAKLGHYPNVQEHLCILSHYPGLLRMPVTVLTMLAAASVGCLVALRIRDRNLLLPVVMFAAVIDLWTVTRGPVSALMRSAPDVGHAVSAPIPQIGTGAFMPNTFVGPGDSLFMALVFAAVCRLKMNGPRNYWFVFSRHDYWDACGNVGFAGLTAGIDRARRSRSFRQLAGVPFVKTGKGLNRRCGHRAADIAAAGMAHLEAARGEEDFAQAISAGLVAGAPSSPENNVVYFRSFRDSPENERPAKLRPLKRWRRPPPCSLVLSPKLGTGLFFEHQAIGVFLH